MGSIGRRHVRCLVKLGYTDIIALRTKKGALKDQSDDLLPYVKEVYTWEDFYLCKPHGVIISNPTALHISTITEVNKYDVPIFVEKPLASELDEFKELEKENVDFKNIIVGYCMRFHPVTKTIHEFLEKNRLGKFYKGRFYFGSYLPNWHPGIDYRSEYMSRKDLGGGVLRTLAHEIDLVQHLLGPILLTNGFVGHTSHLELDNVDDTVYMNCFIKNGGVAQVELDYLSPDYSREGYLIGERGKLSYSFNKNSVHFIDYENNQEELLALHNYDINEMYMQQMKDFTSWVNGDTSENCNYREGKRINELIEELESFSNNFKINY